MERGEMFKISAEEKKELLRYLFKRPYMEVAALINMVAALPPIDKAKEKNGKDKTN
tara:strand:+ start:374 stop:541 length:168 start_codon:yes stop_codon:yes gene_type:complete